MSVVLFCAVAPGHKNQLLLVLLCSTKAPNGQDSQERPHLCLLASTSAASVRDISMLMTPARSQGEEGGR